MPEAKRRNDPQVVDRLENTTAWQAQFPRIDFDCPAMIKVREGVTVKGRVHALSLRGVQILVDRPGARAIRPTGKPLEKGEEQALSVAMRVPGAEGPTVVAVRCWLRYFRILEGQKVLFVLRFHRFEGDGAKRLARFIEQSLIPVS